MVAKKHAPSVPKAVHEARAVIVSADPGADVIAAVKAVEYGAIHEPKPAPKGIVYAVTLRHDDGTETVEVRADSGDDAAAKASKPGCQVVGVVPA